MKRLFAALIWSVVSLYICAQAPTGNRGFKLPANGKRAVVYRLEGVDGYATLPRTLEDNLYFKVEEGPTKTINGKDYALIFIPPYADVKTLRAAGWDSTRYVGTPYNRLWEYDGRTRWWLGKAELEGALPYYARGWSSITLTSGAITLPVLLRPQRGDTPFTLDADVNLGTSAGVRMRLSNTRERFASLLGIAALKQIKHTSTNNTAIAEGEAEVEGSGLALGAGLTFDWDGVQTGLFLGCDKASGSLSKDYVYQDALWIGFGIGVNLFTPTTNSPASDSNR